MSTSGNKAMVLAGDVGGTKTNLGLFRLGRNRPIATVVETYASQEAADLESIVEQFLHKHRPSIAGVCFGIAGPVIGGVSKTTNLPWNISQRRLQRRFNWTKVRLLNDLAATALSVPLLNSQEFHPLNKARARKGQNIGIVAPGTGLGQALLVAHADGYFPVSSEGGHADFPPNNQTEAELWHYLRHRFGHVSAERVVSGPGLVNIYSWLKESGPHREPDWLARRLQEQDPARAITEAALKHSQRLCVEALNLFVAVLGSVAGNLALTAMTTGGVYLGGGIPPKILPKLKEGLFMESFTNKGRYKKLLEGIAVRVIMNERAALLGAAHEAFAMTRSLNSFQSANYRMSF